METILWYKKPASNWNEALPLGNGQLGAMVFGGISKVRYGLNHDTLWSGYPRQKNEEDLTEYYNESLRLAMKKEYRQAQDIIESHLCSDFTEGYMPLGDLVLNINVEEDQSEYIRKLNLETASCETEYKVNDVIYRRNSFISNPHNCMVIRLTTTGENNLSFKAELTSKLRFKSRKIYDNLLLIGRCPSHVAPNYVQSEEPVIYDDENPGISFACGISIKTDGIKEIFDDYISISGANFAEIVLVTENNYVDYKTLPKDSSKSYEEKCIERLEDLKKFNYHEIYESHKKDYKELEKSCSLDLNNNFLNSNLPTDDRLKLFEENSEKEDLGLYELLFKYGRYLLIASSRDRTQAANLQGIWNEDIRAPWCSNYTLNINTEMNYWPVFMTGLKECAEPLITLVRELSEAGKKVANNIYGAKGFTCHHNTDLWRATNPVGEHQIDCACYGFWPMAAAWLCRGVFEYYEYTQDIEYLKDIAFPILKESAEFIISIVSENEYGELIVSPTTSPENNFKWKNEVVSISQSSAMSQAIAYDLLNNTLKASKILNDNNFATKLNDVLNRLKLIEIGNDGRILEWNEDVEEVEVNHRHVSHLYALHPAQIIDSKRDINLADACRNSLNTRGDSGTGWSLAWKINLWARLNDGEKALSLLRQQLHYVKSTTINNFDGGGTYPNLFCAHPPFQIDGNFGAVSGIAEMLMRSTEGEVNILPALPHSWESGRIKGLVARGNIKIDIKWDNGYLDYIELTSPIRQNVNLIYKDREKKVLIDVNETIKLTLGDFSI